METKSDIICSVPCFGKISSDVKEIYTNTLITILTPLLYEGFQSMFDKASKLSDEYDKTGKNIEIENPGIDSIFQLFIANFKKLNNTLIEEEVNRIRSHSQCADYFDDLIRAVIKSHIVVMTYSTNESKLLKDKFYDNVDINSFIHKCYIESSKFIYNNPKLFHTDRYFHQRGITNIYTITQQIRTNKEIVFQHIKAGINTAISQILPMKIILNEYLNTDSDALSREYMEKIKNMIITEMREINTVNEVKDDVNLLEDEKNTENVNNLLEQYNNNFKTEDVVNDKTKFEQFFALQKQQDIVNKQEIIDEQNNKSNHEEKPETHHENPKVPEKSMVDILGDLYSKNKGKKNANKLFAMDGIKLMNNKFEQEEPQHQQDASINEISVKRKL